MSRKITFLSEGGEITFKIKDDNLWQNAYEFFAFLAESGTGKVRFLTGGRTKC